MSGRRPIWSGMAWAVAAGLLLASGAVLAAPPTPEQRSCILALGAHMGHVSEAQGERNGLCVADYSGSQQDSIPACLAAASEDEELARMIELTLDLADGRCSGSPPQFGASDPNTVVDAAIEFQSGLLVDLFGSDLDTAIVSADEERNFARCQIGVERSARECAERILGAYQLCKRKELRQPQTAQPTSAQELAARCLMTAGDPTRSIPDPKARIASYCRGQPAEISRLERVIERRCFDRGLSDPSVLFPGACGNVPAELLHACILRRLDCRICKLLKTADALPRNCDLFDDGFANASCFPP